MNEQTENQDDKAMKNTYAGRTLRIKNLIDFLKQNSPTTLATVYRHMMLEYFLSSETVDKYIRDLETSQIIKVQNPETSPVWPIPSDKITITYTGKEESL